MTENEDEVVLEETESDTEPTEQQQEPQTVEVTVTTESRPFLSTDFSDYSVSEGLLLCIFLVLLVNAIFRILRRGFSWLL